MEDRLPARLDPPVLFAHRGARAHAPENTIEAFRLALRLGASGIESDVWLTSDGVAVLDHDGVLRQRLRRVPLAEVPSTSLPEGIPTLALLYETCGVDVELSLDIKDPAAFDVVVDVARHAGASEHLWACHPDVDLLGSWRERSGAVRLVHSTRIGALGGSPESHAARLRSLGIDAVNLHHSEWNGGMAALYHRFGRLALGWDAQHERVIRSLYRAGLDGIYSDHVDRMVEVVGDAIGDSGRQLG